MNTPKEISDAAAAWLHSESSLIPVKADGTKAPAVPWKSYMTTPPTEQEIIGWFGDNTGTHTGLGVICGATSDHLELIEWEGRAVREGLLAAMGDQIAAAGELALWEHITTLGYVEQTPSGGIHIFYRITGGTARPNTKLARRPSNEQELADNPKNKLQVLIETRGEGGYAVVAPTDGRHHTSSNAWTVLQGSPQTLPYITAEQRDVLYAIANSLDQMPALAAAPEPAPRRALPEGSNPGVRPGDDYNTKTEWEEILTGWTRIKKLGAGYGWKRPGKTDPGISATTGTAADGIDRIYVFSTSTEFDTETPYSKFAAYTLLNHRGDYKAAAKTLGSKGFGERPTPSNVTPIRRTLTRDGGPPVIPNQPTTDGTAALAPTTPPRPSPRYTDDGNAQELIKSHGDRIRYCPDRGRWLAWIGTRWQWQPSGGGIVRELIKDVAHNLATDSDAAAAWRLRSLSAIGTSNALLQATTDPRINVPIGAIDADPWALGTPQGSVDLRTGQLTPPNPAQLLTRAAHCVPDPDADQSLWLDFLATTFGKDQELIDYLQRLVGYSATGHIGPHVLPFAYGKGGNGKGVFLEGVCGTLGDYGTTTPNAFLMARNYSQHETEIARLAGARMVLCSEVNETDRFDEAKVKQLTGGDTLTARFMRQDHFTFTPSHHLWMMGNYRPAVTSGGRGFWRRCRLIPFLHQVPKDQEVDDLQNTFIRDHGPAVLQWIIDGAAAYHRDGLQEPASVTQATAEYAHDQDTVGRFVEESCHRAPGQNLVKVAVRDLFGEYERWCSETGDTAVTAKRFTQELHQRFEVGSTRSHGKRFYTAISLISDRDGDDAPGTRSANEERYR